MQQDIKAVYQIDNKSVYDIRTLSIIKIKQFSIIEILNNFKQKGIDKIDEKIKKLAIIIIFRGRKDLQDIIKDIHLNVSDPIKSMQRFQEFVNILQLYSEDDINNALKKISQEQIEQLLKVYIEGNEITKKYSSEIIIQSIEKYFTQSTIKRKCQNDDIKDLLDHAFDVYESRITDQQIQQKEWDQVRKEYEEQLQKQQKDSEASSIKPNNQDNQDFEDQLGQAINQEQQIVEFNLGQVIDLEINDKDKSMELEQIEKEIQIQDIKSVTNMPEQNNQTQKPNTKSFFELIQQSNNQKKQPQQQQQLTKSKKGQQKKKLPTELAQVNTDVYKQIQSQIIQLKGAVKNQKEQIIEEQKQNIISVEGDEVQLWENIQEQIKGESWYEEVNQQVEGEQNSFIPILKRIAPITVSRWEKQQQIEKENMKLQREKDQQEKQQQEIRLEQEKYQQKQSEKLQEKQQEKQQEKKTHSSFPEIEFNPIREEHSLFQSRLDYHRQLFKQKEKQEVKKQQNIIEIESLDDEIKNREKKQSNNQQKQFEIIDDEPQTTSEYKTPEKQQQQILNKEPQEIEPKQQQIQDKVVIEKLSDNIPNKYRRHENASKYRTEDIIYTPQQQQENQIQNNSINYDIEIPIQYDQDLIFDESVDSLDLPNMETTNLDLSQDVEILEDYTKKNNLKNQLDFYNNGLQENKIFHIRPELKPLNNDQKAATLLSLLKITKFNLTIRQVQQDKQQLLRDKGFHSFIRIIYNIITNYLQERIKIQIKQIIHSASKFYGEITIQMPNGKTDQQQYEAENQFVGHTFLRLIGLDFIIKNVYGNKQDMTFLDIIKYLAAKISSKTYQEYKELTQTEVPIQQDPQPRVRNWEMIFYEEEKEKDNEFIDKVQQRMQPRTQLPQDAKQQALKNIQQQEYYRQTQKIQEQSINIQSQKNQKDQNKSKQSSQKRQQKQDKNQKKMNQKKNKDISSEEEGEVKIDILEKVKQQQDTFEKNLMSKILQGIQVGIQEGIQQVQKSVDTKLQQIEEKQQVNQKQINQQSEHKNHMKNNSSNKREGENKNQNKNKNQNNFNVNQVQDISNTNYSANQTQNNNQNKLIQNQNNHQNTNQQKSSQQSKNQQQIQQQQLQQQSLEQHDFYGQDNQKYQIPHIEKGDSKHIQSNHQRNEHKYSNVQQNIQLKDLQIQQDLSNQDQYEQNQNDYNNQDNIQQLQNYRKKNKLNPEQQYQGYPNFNQIIPDLQCSTPTPQQFGLYNHQPIQYIPSYQQYHPPIQHQIPLQNHNPYVYHQYPIQNQYYPPNNQHNNQNIQQRKPNNKKWK